MVLEGCVALVTGANRGLGRAFTDALLSAGAAKVYAGVRDPAAAPAGCAPVRLDVTSRDDVAAAARACGDVTLLINNAGNLMMQSAMAPGAEAGLRSEMDVHVYGALRMAQAFAPILARNGGGAIVNMLSAVAWYTAPFNATYCAAKHAALALSDSMRIELKAQGTHVASVFAGLIDTDMVAQSPRAKTPPAQIAARTLEGLREGRDEILADAHAEETWRQMRADPYKLAANMQAAWDQRQRAQ